MTEPYEEFYEVEIDGVVRRIRRRDIAALAAEIADQEGGLTEAFRNHPHVDVEATEEPPPHGTEPDDED
jgi:hypothetical protein